MSTLRETIEHFQDFILDKQDQIEHEIVGADRDFKQVRLNVYHDGYALRLLEILFKTFPTVCILMGDEAFETAARDYIAHYPSNHFSVRYFGRHFAKFLANYHASKPLWVEMAAFEWALEYAVDAADAPQLTFDEMATLSPEAWSELRLKTHPSLQIVPFSNSAPEVWQAIQLEEEIPVTQRSEEPVQWLIWRFELRSYFCPTTPQQIWMMRAIQEGKNFSDICAGLCEWLGEDEVVNFAAVTLRQWITEGIFSEMF